MLLVVRTIGIHKNGGGVHAFFQLKIISLESQKNADLRIFWKKRKGYVFPQISLELTFTY